MGLLHKKWFQSAFSGLGCTAVFVRDVCQAHQKRSIRLRTILIPWKKAPAQSATLS